MQIGIVGCGFVADFYAASLKQHPELSVRAVHDRSPSRLRSFSEHFGYRACETFQQLLDHPEIQLIVNLTTPDSHFAVTRAALLAGKHVYTEKPMTLDLASARELAALADQAGLRLGSAPCSLLSPTAQTVWQLLRERAIGEPKLVYAELDDGAIHQKTYRGWRNQSGAPWPFVSEFETGCTNEHAAYYLSWLTAFFGPVRKLIAMSDCVYPDKQTDVPIRNMAPDLAIGLIRFESGVRARLTCGLVAPTDHSLTIVGDAGVLQVRDAWDYSSPVLLRRRIEPLKHGPDENLSDPIEVPLRAPRRGYGYHSAHNMDFASGVAELAAAIAERRRSSVDAEHALHVLEVVLALQGAGAGAVVEVTSTFPPIRPAAVFAES